MATLKKNLALAGDRLGLRPAQEGVSVIGTKDGFPVQLTAVRAQNAERIVEFVRFGNAGRDAEVRAAILASDGPVRFRAGRLRVKNGLVAYQNVRRMFRRLSVDRVVEELEAIVQAVKNVVPLPAAGCLRCGSGAAVEPMLLDGVVDRICSSCVERVKHEAKLASDRYDNLPMNLSLAVPAAAVLALVAAVGWAALVIATQRMFWLAGAGIGILIGWGTTRAAGKGGLPVQVLSAAFTIVAVLLGQLLVVGWHVNQQARAEGMDVDWKAFAADAPNILVAGGSDTVFALAAGLVGALSAIARASKPRLQVSVERTGQPPTPRG